MGAGLLSVGWVLASSQPNIVDVNLSREPIRRSRRALYFLIRQRELDQAGIDGVGEYRSEHRLSQSQRRYIIDESEIFFKSSFPDKGKKKGFIMQIRFDYRLINQREKNSSFIAFLIPRLKLTYLSWAQTQTPLCRRLKTFSMLYRVSIVFD